MNGNIVRSPPIDSTDAFSKKKGNSAPPETELAKAETEHELDNPIHLYYTQSASTQLSESSHEQVWSTSLDDKMDSFAVSQPTRMPSSMESPDISARVLTSNGEPKVQPLTDTRKSGPELSWRSVRVEGSQLPFSLSGESGLGLTQIFEDTAPNNSTKRYVTIRESQELRRQMTDARNGEIDSFDSFDSPPPNGTKNPQSKSDSKFATLRMPAKRIVHHLENNHLNTVDADGPDVSQLQVPASIGKSNLASADLHLPSSQIRIEDEPHDVHGDTLYDNLTSAEYSDAVQRTPLHDKGLDLVNDSAGAGAQKAPLLPYNKKSQREKSQREKSTSGSIPNFPNERRSSSPIAATSNTILPHGVASSSPPRDHKRRKIERHQIIDDSQPANFTHPVSETNDNFSSDEVFDATKSSHISNSEVAQSQNPIVNPHRVFARFNDEFHPGTVLRPSMRDKFLVVKFEDDQDFDIPEHLVFRLDLHPGDVLRGPPVNDKKTRFTVHSLETHNQISKSTCIRGYDMIKGQVKGCEGFVYVPVSLIYLKSGMLTPFVQRRYVYKSALEVPSPTQEQAQGEMPHAPTKLLSNIFSGALFSLSLGLKNSKQKDNLSQMIIAHGGTVLDDGLHELFRFEADEDGCFRGYSLHRKMETFTFACIIANRHSESVKYLQALAMRLPCLATKFISDSIKAGGFMNWEPYMLAAGESEWLGDNIKSMVVPPFVHKSLKVRWSADNSDKLLHERRILFISPDKGKNVGDMHLFLLLFLGATVMIVDSESPAFGLTPSKKWDMAYCPNMDQRLPVLGIPIKRRKWLIQSLILGRIIDINLGVDL